MLIPDNNPEKEWGEVAERSVESGIFNVEGDDSELDSRFEVFVRFLRQREFKAAAEELRVWWASELGDFPARIAAKLVTIYDAWNVRKTR